MKKLLSIMLSIIMILTSLLSVGYIALADDDEESKLYYGKYYVGDEYFKYVTGNDEENDSFEDGYWNDVYPFELYITGYSSGFSRKLVIPDEIDGIEKSVVYLKDYRYLETVVLSDGILLFECFDDQGLGKEFADEWVWSKREENNIRYLYVGKIFSEMSLIDTKRYRSQKLENLEEVHVSEENEKLASVNGIVYTKDLKTVVFVPEKSTANLIKEVTEIGDYAYAYCNDRFVSIPKKVKRIGYAAFAHSKIRTAYINKQITFIDQYAFDECKKLEAVWIKGNSKKVFERGAFDRCKKLKEVYIDSNKIPEFKKHAFRGTKKGIKFYVENKKLAKKLKTALKKTGVDNAKIYVDKKLICTKK